MDQDNTILIKKESKIKSTSSIQDKMNQNDIVHIKKESKTVSPSPIQDTLERDHNVHIVFFFFGLTQSNQIPGNKTLLSHNMVSDLYYFLFIYFKCVLECF